MGFLLAGSRKSRMDRIILLVYVNTTGSHKAWIAHKILNPNYARFNSIHLLGAFRVYTIAWKDNIIYILTYCYPLYLAKRLFQQSFAYLNCISVTLVLKKFLSLLYGNVLED